MIVHVRATLADLYSVAGSALFKMTLNLQENKGKEVSPDRFNIIPSPVVVFPRC